MRRFPNVVSISFLLLFSLSISAQNLLECIPNDAAIVAGINPLTLKEKVDMGVIKNMEFYQTLLDELTKGANPKSGDLLADLIDQPQKYGMDLNSSSYLFSDKSAGGHFISYIFQLSDAKAFNSFLKDELISDPDSKIKAGSNFSFAREKEMILAWNEQMALLTTRVNNPMFKGQELNKFKPSVAKVLRSKAEQTFNPDKSNSILTNPQFLQARSIPNDAFLWMDYAYLKEMGKKVQDRVNRSPDSITELNQMSSILDGNYLMVGLVFEQGKVQLNSKYYFNPELNHLMEGMVDASINPRFLRYIDREELRGYYSFAFNIEKMIKGIAELYTPLLGNESPDIDRLITEAMDSLGMPMSAGQFYTLLKGDCLLAFTGMKEFQKRVISYDYDDDFNRKEIEKWEKGNYPEFSILMSYNNKEDLMPFIDIGLESALIIDKGKYYQFSVPSIPVDFYLVMQKGILLLTNNTELLGLNFKKGIKKKDRLSKEHLLAIKNNAQVFYLDFNKLVGEFSDVAKAMGPSGDQLMNIGRQNAESLWFNVQKPASGSMNAVFELNFSNKQVNSLEQIIRFFNDIYLNFSSVPRS